MKHTGLLLIMAAVLFLTSCADKPARPENILTEAQKAAADAAASAAASAGIQSGPAGIGSLPHYYCPNSCEGSGGDAQANCPTCGTAYVHNAAFHNQAPTPPPAAGTVTGSPTGQTISGPSTIGGTENLTTTPITPTQTKAPEPPQNAKGVWHYTCSAGCAGGGGGAGNCASCGGPLAHNAEYHN